MLEKEITRSCFFVPDDNSDRDVIGGASLQQELDAVSPVNELHRKSISFDATVRIHIVIKDWSQVLDCVWDPVKTIA